jgi:hypothetical protein
MLWYEMAVPALFLWLKPFSLDFCEFYEKCLSLTSIALMFTCHVRMNLADWKMLKR